MTTLSPPDSRDPAPPQLEDAHLAVLNILDDVEEERAHLSTTQMAMMNLLEDSHDAEQTMEMSQLALLNILDDVTLERLRLDHTNSAMLNILADAVDEKERVETAQRAVMNILEDLESERAAVERTNRDLARSNAELEQFAYVTSHDLSEPLRAIAGPVSLLGRRYQDRLDDEANQFIEFAVDGCRRMQKMIDDLLVYSRVGRLEEAVRPTEAGVVLDGVLASLRPLIVEARAELRVGKLPTVRADPTQLGQLLQNLVTNALKFVGTGQTPEIDIEAERCGPEWRFRVTDNGIGIDPQHRERIWGMFKRLHTRDEYAGTGIGLALARKIVERHGGEIGVEAGPGGTGSRFWFTLPASDEFDLLPAAEGDDTC